MKKTIYLLLLLMLFKLPCMAQTPAYSEDFSSGEGWNLDENWLINGGKMLFVWSPTITNFNLSATSEPITLMDNAEELIVTQYLDIFGASSPSEEAEIIIMANGDEFLLWEHLHSSGNWGQPAGTELLLDISEFAGEEVQIKFRTHGPSTFEWNSWNIFKLEILVMLENDLTITEVEGPLVIDVNEPGSWEVDVKNLGSLPQTDFTLKLFSFKYGDMIGEMVVSDAIDPGQTKTFTFDWTPIVAHNTALYGVVIKEGDEFEDNNISKSHFVRVSPDIEFNILVWDNDNDIETITDPDKGDLITPATGLIRALESAGLDYDFCTSLPDDLFSYEVLFGTMGCYCVS